MKIIITLLLIICHINAQDFYPDVNSTRDIDAMTIAEQAPDGVLVKYDVKTSAIVDLNQTLLENLADKMGMRAIASDFNLTNEEDLKGYIDSINFQVPSIGNSIGDQLRKNVDRFNSEDTESYTQDAILDKDLESVDSRAIMVFENFEASVRSRLANIAKVECYVTRKLANSYYCPLPTRDNSFFHGGDFKDSKEEAVKACEKICKEPSTCISKDINKPVEKIVEDINLRIVGDSQYLEIPIDELMSLNYIQLDFAIKYQYNDNIAVESEEYNASVALEEIKKYDRGLRLDVSYWDYEALEYRQFMTSKKVTISDSQVSMKIYLPSSKVGKIKYQFYSPYVQLSASNYSVDDKLQLTLVSSRVKYKDNKYWFCPLTHFVSNIDQCKGEVEVLSVGATTYNLCKTTTTLRRESRYGAFYTEQDCSNKCLLKGNCVPTYRHLESINPLNLPDSIKDIEIGCVESPTNTSCTKEICEELFIADKMPLLEQSWVNDDDIKITVANSVQVEGKMRPKIDIAGGLSANDNPDARAATSIREMTELSYINMIETDTFNVSAKTINEAIPVRNANRKQTSTSGSFSVFWDMKPNSFDVDNGSTYYMYSVMEVNSIFSPRYGTYNTAAGVQTGSTDLEIKIQDKTYLIKTSTGYKIIRKIENSSGRFMEYSSCVACPKTYSWGPMNEYRNEMNKTFANDTFVAYDTNGEADYFTSVEFSSDKKIENNMLFSSFESLAEQEGVLIHSQTPTTNAAFKRNYSGARVEGIESYPADMTAYGFYSKRKLSYAEVMAFINQDNAIYSTSRSLPAKISKDGRTAFDKVDFMISGAPNTFSVNADFAPNKNEEGKKTFIFMLLYED